MSKRDDLENEAKGEIGLFGALAIVYAPDA